MEDSLSIASTLDVVGSTVLGDSLFVGGDVTLRGNVIPETDNDIDLGSIEKSFRDLFVSESSIWLGDRYNITVEDNMLKAKKRDITKIPPQIRKFFATLSEAETYSLTVSGKSTISEITRSDWFTIANAKLDSDPLFRINGKTKSQLSITDLFSKVTKFGLK